MKRKLPAYPVFLVISGASALFFTMMSFISAIYRVQTAGLNPLQLVLVGTALETGVFLFEVPTGIVADIYSRRLSVIIGYALIGVGFMLEGALPIFATILLAQVVWGVGYTFISGAQDAWLADEIGEAQLTGAYLRASQLGRLGSLVGILLGVALGTIAPAVPLFLAGVLMVALSLFLLLFMPETGFAPTPRPERNSWQKMEDTLRDGLRLVRSRRLLMLIVAIAVFFGLSSEGLDRLWEAHLLQNFSFPAIGWLQDAVLWFGVIKVITLLLSFALTELVRRRVDVDEDEIAIRVQILLNALVVAAVVVFGLASSFGVAVVAIIGVQLFRSANGPLFQAWINKQITPQVRATVLSMYGQVDAISQIVGGPILGAVATAISIPAAMVGVGVLLSPVLLLYLIAQRWTKGETGAVQQAEPSL